MSRYKPLRLGDKMPFGKYKGYTIEEIKKLNYGYFIWMRDKSDIKLDLSEPSKKTSNLASLSTKLKGGKYKGCTVAEVIRCNPEYIKVNLADKNKLDRKAEYYLSCPQYALKALLQEIGWEEKFKGEEEMVKEAIYLRNGMNYMTSLQITNPVFSN